MTFRILVNEAKRRNNLVVSALARLLEDNIVKKCFDARSSLNTATTQNGKQYYPQREGIWRIACKGEVAYTFSPRQSLELTSRTLTK